MTTPTAISQLCIIGASAGALSSLQEFFEEASESNGTCYIVAQHLSPDFKSLMPELLAKHTKLGKSVVEHGDALQANHIHFIPGGTSVTFSDEQFRVVERADETGVSFPIDELLISAAQGQRLPTCAVILSGTGTDGSRGIKHIKNAGGMVYVEDPVYAKFNGMPNAAIATKSVDSVLQAEDIAKAINIQLEEEVNFLDTRVDARNRQIKAWIFDQINLRHNIDFGLYKDTTIVRRLEKIQLLRGHDTLEQFAEELKRDNALFDELHQEFLIGVTDFFRDDEVWQKLEEEVIPRILESSPHNELRVWVVGCSSGQEVYSLAMMLTEAIQRSGSNRTFKIFGSDVDELAIQKANTAIYTADETAHIPKHLFEKYLSPVNGGYRFRTNIIKRTLFVRHNALVDPPFVNTDLVTCRNVLIYIKPAVQRRMLTNLAYALRPESFMLLGPSETLGELSSLFEAVDRNTQIYRLKPGERPNPVLNMRPTSTGIRKMPPLLEDYTDESHPRTTGFQRQLDDHLLTHFLPRVFVVGARGEVAYMRGEFSALFRHSQGGQPLNIKDLRSEQHQVHFSNAIRKVRENGETLLLEGIELPQGFAELQIRISKLGSKKLTDDLVLVAFEAKDTHSGTASKLVVEPLKADISAHINDLETELIETRRSLGIALEDLDANREELQSSNEELLASNEELQSTNEELQSVNEELYTVNAELQERMKELVELNDDLENILKAADVGVLLLDENNHIRRFNDTFRSIVDIKDSDISRPISLFNWPFSKDMLSDDLAQVLETKEPVERIRKHGVSQKHYLVRVRPYLTSKDEQHGMLISVVDIDESERSKHEIIRGQKLLREVSDLNPSLSMLLASEDQQVRFVSKSVADFWRADAAISTFADLNALISEEELQALQVRITQLQKQEITEFDDVIVEVDTDRGSRYHSVAGRIFSLENNHVDTLLLAFLDVHEALSATKARDAQAAIYRTVFDSVSDVLTLFDAESEIVDQNHIPGGLTIDQVKGDGWKRIYPEEAVAFISSKVQQAFGEGSVPEYPLSTTMPDGSTSHFLNRLVRITMNERDLVLATTADITEAQQARVELEAALTQSQEHMQRLQQTKADLERFAFVASHDLQEPVRIIGQQMQLLQMDLPEDTPDNMRSLVSNAVRSTERLTQLIRGLLDFARVGQDAVDFQRISGDDWLHEILEELDLRSEEKKAQITATPLGTFEADPVLLGRVLRNLISNSLKFVAPGTTPEVKVSKIETDDGIALVVADNGIGINQEKLQKVFDIFYREHTQDVYPGHGIGLTMVKRMADQMGIGVSIESELGVGTTVTLNLPQPPALPS